MAEQSNQQQQASLNLPKTQQEVASQAFESAVSPLREEFKGRLGTTTEELARRGIQFGGVGQQRLGDVFKEQSRIEGQIASGLGARLGQSALEQAFAANEAAKARQFQAEQAGVTREFQAEQGLLGREFAGGQAGLAREFQSQQAELGRGLTREQIAAQQQEAAAQRGFAGEQAELGRGLTREQLEAQRQEAELGRGLTREQIAAQQQEAAAQRGFAGEQAELGRGLTREQLEAQRQEAELGRGLTREQLAAQRQEAGLQREFLGEESQLARTFQEQAQIRQATETRLQREFAGDQAKLQQEFAAEQALLGRVFTGQENTAERARLTEEARLQREFAGDEAAASRAFQKEEQLLGRTFTAAESQLQRDFLQAEREADLEFKSTQADLQRQDIRDENFLNLVLSGNIATNEEALAKIEETFGEGVAFSNEDAADMRRIAAAAGLSVEDYTKMKRAIGEGQLAEVLRNPDDFILNPEDLQTFQIRMAEIEADSQARAAEAASGGGKVLCTELNRQGLLPDDIYQADLRIGSTMDPKVISGYHIWATPIVSLMRKSKVVTYLLKPFITSWARHMAYVDGVLKKDDLMGRALEAVGLPICYFIGSFIKDKCNKREVA